MAENKGNLLDISSLMSGVITKQDISAELDIKCEDVSDSILKFECVCIKGTLENISGYIHFTADISCDYITNCARCLSEIKCHLDVELDKSVCNSGVLEDEDSEDVITNYLIIDNNRLDLDNIVREELVFALPYRELCKEDCRGLCSKCGKNLNEGDCGCDRDEPKAGYRRIKDLI